MSCPELFWTVSLFSDDVSARIGTIEDTPLQSEPTERPEPLWQGRSGAVYVAITGEDRYCAYPVATDGPLMWNGTSAAPYGQITTLRASNARSLPAGVLVGADGTAYAQMAYGRVAQMSRWYLVGDVATARVHLRAIGKLAAQIGKQWKQSRNGSAVPPSPPQPPMKKNRVPESNPAAVADVIEWSKTALEGDPRIADELDGLYRIGQPTAATADAEAVYNFLNDTMTIYPWLSDRIEQNEYAVASNILRHELTHRASHDRPLIAPLWEQVQAGIAVYGRIQRCRDEGHCEITARLSESEVHALTAWLFQTDPVEELLGYNVQLVDAERFDPATRKRILRMFAPFRDRMLQEIVHGRLPVEVFELSRDYYVDGLQQFLSDPADQETLQACIADYDRALASARRR